MVDQNLWREDPLTKLYTREHLFPILKKRIIDAKLHNEQLSILLVDIDHFKKINDKYGHLWGDEFLKFVSSTLRFTLEDKGLIFRYGGDEFVVLFSTQESREAFSLARQFNLVMRNRPFLFNGRLFKLTISCGLATYPHDAQGTEDLLKAADRAMYFSKRYGRNITTRAGKIGVQKFKIISIVFIEVLLIAALVFFLNTYLFKENIQRFTNRLIIDRLLSTVFKPNTKIVLKDGTTIRGRIIAEDQDNLFIITPLDKEAASIILKKLKFNP